MIGRIGISDAAGLCMDIECLRSFLEVAATRSFTLAAGRLNLAQSTISARIKLLEEQLGQALFRRTVTASNRRRPAGNSSSCFDDHPLLEQARQDIAVPEGDESLLRLTAPVNLWDRIISGWVPWMREHQPSVALRLEGSFPDTAIDQLIEGLLDICILYAPRSRPGVVIETLAEEQVVLVRHAGRYGALGGELYPGRLGSRVQG